MSLAIGLNFFDWDKISADIIKREEKNKLKQKTIEKEEQNKKV